MQAHKTQLDCVQDNLSVMCLNWHSKDKKSTAVYKLLLLHLITSPAVTWFTFLVCQGKWRVPLVAFTLLRCCRSWKASVHPNSAGRQQTSKNCLYLTGVTAWPPLTAKRKLLDRLEKHAVKLWVSQKGWSNTRACLTTPQQSQGVTSEVLSWGSSDRCHSLGLTHSSAAEKMVA